MKGDEGMSEYRRCFIKMWAEGVASVVLKVERQFAS